MRKTASKGAGICSATGQKDSDVWRGGYPVCMYKIVGLIEGK